MIDEREFFNYCHFSVCDTIKRLKEIHSDPEGVHLLCMYGLGVLDTACFGSEEFRECRIRALDKDDSDVQAFITATRVFHDWMMSKGYIPSDVCLKS